MHVVSHKDTYAAIRNDISERVEVFIAASFNVGAKKSRVTDVGVSVIYCFPRRCSNGLH